MLRFVAQDHRKKFFVADLYHSRHVLVLLSECVGDGLKKYACLNEVVEGESLLRLRVVTHDDQLCKLGRQSVAQRIKRCITQIHRKTYKHSTLQNDIHPLSSGKAKGVGCTWQHFSLGTADKQNLRLKNSRENSDCEFCMCLSAIKTTHYSQHVPIVGTVGYNIWSMAASGSLLLGITPISCSGLML